MAMVSSFVSSEAFSEVVLLKYLTTCSALKCLEDHFMQCEMRVSLESVHVTSKKHSPEADIAEEILLRL